jgi:NitT/TauT family transport system substrate-binding protein
MNRRRFLPILAAFLCSVLITVGCTPDAPEADAPTNGADVPATATEGPPVRLGYSNWAGWWPWAIAESEGLFEANGANVELIWFDGYLESMQALAAGQLDANSQTLNDTISFVDDAVNGMVAVLVNDNSAGNDKIIGAEDIETIADFEGRTVALEEGVVGDFLMNLALEDAGLSRDDVQIQNLETGAAAAAFAAGQVDGFAGWVPFWETALTREGSREIVTSEEYPGAIPDLLVTSQTLIDERPEQVQALIDTWFDVLDFIDENPEEAAAIMAQRAGVSSEEFEIYTEGTRIFTLDENLEAFSDGNGAEDMVYMPYAAQVMTDFMVEVGFIPSAPDLEAIFDDQFVQAYAEQQ